MFLFLPPFHHPRHLKSGVHLRGHVGRRVYFTTFTNFLSEMNKRYSGILITNLCITKLGNEHFSLPQRYPVVAIAVVCPLQRGTAVLAYAA